MMDRENYLLAQRWFDAFNSKDLKALLALYDNDASHYSPKLKIAWPETGGMIKGKKALSDWWQDAFERLPGLHYEIKKILASSDMVFMEYLRQVPGEADQYVGEVLEISGGKIIASRVYHG